MSKIFQFKTIKLNSCGAEKLLDNMFRLRYQKHVIEQKWSSGLTIRNGKETDDYDNNNAVYIIGIDKNDNIVASLRLISTKHSYIINDNFPDLVEYINLPNTNKIWEASRLTLRHTSNENFILIYHAAFEFGIKNSISNFIFWPDEAAWKKYSELGFHYYPLGKTKVLEDKFKISVALMPISKEIINSIMIRNNITTPKRIKSKESIAIC